MVTVAVVKKVHFRGRKKINYVENVTEVIMSHPKRGEKIQIAAFSAIEVAIQSEK